MKFIYFLFYFFLFFCYVKITPNSMDTQPNYIVLGTLIIFFEIIRGAKLDRNLLYVWVVSFIVLLFCFYNLSYSDKYFDIIRSLVGYISIPVTFTVIFLSKKYNIINEKLFVYVLSVYFIFGIAQLFFGNDITTILVNSRTSDGRGVTSLTPEPTFYAFIVSLIYLSYIVRMLITKENKFFKVVTILYLMQLLFLSKSAMLIMVFVISIIIIMLLYLVSFVLSFNKVSFKFLLYIFLIPCCVFFINVSGFFEGSRVLNIIDNLDGGVIYLLQLDASINDRVSHIYLSLYGFFENSGMPGFFTSYEYFTGNKFYLSNGVFWYGPKTNIILSYWGTFLYELGVFSIFYFSFFIFAFYSFIRKSYIKYLSLSLVLIFLMLLFLAIPISNPIVIFIVFLMIYEVRIRNVYETN